MGDDAAPAASGGFKPWMVWLLGLAVVVTLIVVTVAYALPQNAVPSSGGSAPSAPPSAPSAPPSAPSAPPSGSGSASSDAGMARLDRLGASRVSRMTTAATEPMDTNPLDQRARRHSKLVPKNGALTSGDPRMFHHTDDLDPLSVHDASPEDLFPRVSDHPPQDGNEAIAQLYSFDNFRAAHARDSRAGYLQPQIQNQGWDNLGARGDLARWMQTAAWLSEDFAKMPDPYKMLDDMMVPIPEHYFDLAHTHATSRGVTPSGDYEGLGAQGARHYAQIRERELGRNKGNIAHLTPAQRAQLVRDSMSVISTHSPSDAARAMRLVAAAHATARNHDVKIGAPSHAQMAAASKWAASSDTEARNAATELVRLTNTPLVPSLFA